MSTCQKDENNDDDDDEDNDGNDDDDITITIKYGHVAEGLGWLGKTENNRYHWRDPQRLNCEDDDDEINDTEGNIENFDDYGDPHNDEDNLMKIVTKH